MYPVPSKPPDVVCLGILVVDLFARPVEEQHSTIVHLGDANRKIEKSFVRQDGTRSEGGANQGVSDYVEIESGAPPLIPTKPSRSKCKMIS